MQLFSALSGIISKSGFTMEFSLKTSESFDDVMRHYLPEADGCYAQISRDGQDVWLIRKEWLPWSFGVEPGDIDMSLPLFRYYKCGELQYTVCLSDVFTEDMLLRNGHNN